MRVAICRPLHSSAYRNHERCMAALERAEPLWEPIPFYCPNLTLGRAAIAEEALKCGYDVLLWVDSDITFTLEAARGIVARARELDAVVGGLYLEKELGGSMRVEWLATLPAGLRVFVEDSPPIEVLSIGFGLVAHPASVLERIAAHHELPWQTVNGERMRPFFTPSTTAAVTYTDDYVFCRLARAAGIKVFADARFRLGHLGEYEFTLDDLHRK